MLLNNLVKIKKTDKKRMGRGLGSGKGKTGGRGTKGQKARGKVPAGFIGGTLPLYRKLPLRRGKSNTVLGVKPEILSLADLEGFKVNEVVDLGSLATLKLISEKRLVKYGVKILGQGEINKALTVRVPVSESAKLKIEKAGGKVENV